MTAAKRLAEAAAAHNNSHSDSDSKPIQLPTSSGASCLPLCSLCRFGSQAFPVPLLLLQGLLLCQHQAGKQACIIHLQAEYTLKCRTVHTAAAGMRQLTAADAHKHAHALACMHFMPQHRKTATPCHCCWLKGHLYYQATAALATLYEGSIRLFSFWLLSFILFTHTAGWRVVGNTQWQGA